MLSQVTDITKEQKQRIEEIFTPEKIIEISKGLSNEQKQDSVIIARDKQIQELQSKIEALKEEHKNTLVAIAKENKKAQETTQEIDSISDHQLKTEKLKWSGLHLYVGAEVPEFTFKNTFINVELMYEFRKLHFGLKGEVNPTVTIENPNTFTYFLKVRYKIF